MFKSKSLLLLYKSTKYVNKLNLNRPTLNRARFSVKINTLDERYFTKTSGTLIYIMSLSDFFIFS